MAKNVVKRYEKSLKTVEIGCRKPARGLFGPSSGHVELPFGLRRQEGGERDERSESSRWTQQGESGRLRPYLGVFSMLMMDFAWILYGFYMILNDVYRIFSVF